jgi:hypothetical protein
MPGTNTINTRAMIGRQGGVRRTQCAFERAIFAAGWSYSANIRRNRLKLPNETRPTRLKIRLTFNLTRFRLATAASFQPAL